MIYKVCISYIFRHPQKTTKPEMTAANTYATNKPTTHTHIDRNRLPEKTIRNSKIVWHKASVSLTQSYTCLGAGFSTSVFKTKQSKFFGYFDPKKILLDNENK